MENKHFMVLASEDNDGSTTNAVGDYSSTAASFQIKAPADKTIEIHRVMVSIEDAAIANSSEYGSISALTNGVRIYVKDGTGTLEELTPFAIKSNGEWAAACHDMTIHSLGNGNDWVTVRWTFSKSGAPITLSSRNGHYIDIVLNDDFTGLVTQRFFFQGYYKTETY